MLTKLCRNGWGASAVDALGTAIVMDLKEPVNDIVKHVKTVNFSKSNTPQAVSLFETTIRYMGGMLSAYDLLREPKRQGMVEVSMDLGRLYAYLLMIQAC